MEESLRRFRFESRLPMDSLDYYPATSDLAALSDHARSFCSSRLGIPRLDEHSGDAKGIKVRKSLDLVKPDNSASPSSV